MSATTDSQPAPSTLRTVLNPERRKIIYGFVAAIGLFIIGEIVKPGFASASGIQQILQISSFVGLVAAGQTFVILIGGIDLSVPWVLNAAAIVLISSRRVRTASSRSGSCWRWSSAWSAGPSTASGSPCSAFPPW